VGDIRIDELGQMRYEEGTPTKKPATIREIMRIRTVFKLDTPKAQFTPPPLEAAG